MYIQSLTHVGRNTWVETSVYNGRLHMGVFKLLPNCPIAYFIL
jgi:hypothetical protein